MYTIFTNDIPESVHCHPPQYQEHVQGYPLHHSYTLDCQKCEKICCFADDSSFSFSNAPPRSVETTFISDFMASQKLKLNSDKTNLLVIRSDTARRANPKHRKRTNRVIEK